MRSPMARGTRITPVLRYRDPRAAAQWLCEAFGFTQHEAVQDAGGNVTYVLLRLGPNFVLVLPVADLALDEHLVQPQAVGGANTQVCYITVADAEAHRTQAERAGAKIEIVPQDDGLGGQFYACRDLDGHLWNFGTQTYGVIDADEGQPETEDLSLAQADAPVPPSGRRSGGRLLVRSMAILVAMSLAALGGWMAHRTFPSFPGADAASAAREGGVVDQERKRLAAAEDAAKKADEIAVQQRATVGDVRRELQQAQSKLQQALSELALERKGKGEAVAALASLKAAVSNLEQGKLRAEARIAAGRGRSAQEKALAKSATERVAALQAQITKLEEGRAADQEDLRKAKLALPGAQALQAQITRLEEGRAADQEDLRKAKLALLSAQAQLKALHTAKPEPSAETAASAPAPREQDTEKAPAPQPSVKQKVASGEVSTGSVTVPPLPESKAESKAETKVETKAEPPKGACAATLLGGRRAPRAWVARLCQGAEGSPEPAHCFNELMRGKVSWGSGSSWTANYALTLCAGSHNASQTIGCFSEKIAADEPWKTAIKDCRNK
jgi:uncharacterized glyoxalase superfamily protein PhnB